MAAGVIALVACSGEKLPLPRGAEIMAKDLYLQSDLFARSRAYVEATENDGWAILSAKYGLVMPEDPIRTYNETLNDMSAGERRVWAHHVAGRLRDNFGPFVKYRVLAGKHYRKALDLLPNAYEVPMEGLGIGEQKQWLGRELEKLGINAKRWRQFAITRARLQS